MTEQKTKRRGWVKNAIIIFLAVMLVLVFFSNTIMNRSLPEVATQYTSSGQINALIRGSGTAVANETFEVKIDQTRTVLSTHVRVGDEVQSGQLLFRLQDSESDELGALREELDNKEYNYRMAMLDASLNDGTQLSKDIQRAQEDLQNAQSAFDRMTPISAEEIERVKNRITARETQVKILTAIRDGAQEELNAIVPDPGTTNSAAEQAVIRAQSAVTAAQNSYNAVYLRYGPEYEALNEIAAQLKTAQDAIPGQATYSQTVYLQALAEEFATPSGAAVVPVPGTDAVFFRDPDGVTIQFPIDTADPTANLHLKADLAEGYQQVVAADEALQSARENYNTALDAYYESNKPGNEELYNQKKQALSKAQADLTEVENSLKVFSDLMSSYEKTNSDYADAKQNLRTLGDSLDNLLLQQRQQGISQTKTAMELERQRTEIEELKTKIAAMETGGEQTEVLAAVSGIVRSLNVSSGNKAQADSALATIEVPDRGYTLNMSVTNEQASKVVVGDMAEVTSYYWGSSVQAQLVSIRNDPERRGEGKLLLFNLTGNVESGSQYNLAIGERSQYYDIIVPNSAIHEDTNGTYVYVVEAKNSPLGNRFFVTRVGVTVLAKDDNNSAVSGSLSGWNSSVVTASPPLTNGMQVRLAENP